MCSMFTSLNTPVAVLAGMDYFAPAGHPITCTSARASWLVPANCTRTYRPCTAPTFTE